MWAVVQGSAVIRAFRHRVHGDTQHAQASKFFPAQQQPSARHGDSSVEVRGRQRELVRLQHTSQLIGREVLEAQQIRGKDTGGERVQVDPLPRSEEDVEFVF